MRLDKKMECVKFKCKFQGCEKKYSNSFNLKRHIESFHQGIKKFYCQLCNKGLSSKQNFREHSFIHSNVKPYKCNYSWCKEAFRQLSQLNLHQNMHIEVQKTISPSKSFFNGDLDILTRILTTELCCKSQEYAQTQYFEESIILPPIRSEKSLKVADKY